MFNWKSITLENYAAIDALNRSVPTDYVQRSISLLSLITGKSEEHYEELPITELNVEIEKLVAFLKTEPSALLMKVFWFQGRRFTILLTQDEVTTNQAMSVSALQLTPENMASKMPELLAAICEETRIPLRKSLTFAQKVNTFKQLPASIGVGVCVFFWEVSKELQEASLRYLETEAEKIRQVLNQNN